MVVSMWLSRSAWWWSTNAALGDDRVGPERAHDRGDHPVPGGAVGGVAGEGRQGDVGSGPGRVRAAGLSGEAGAREEVAAALVHRDRQQHPRLVVEDPLGAVAVVDVEVDVGDALRPASSSARTATAVSV